MFYIEYDKNTLLYFLRGLYDSEGNHYKYRGKYSRIRLYNNSLTLLQYSQYLLEKYFNIHATGPYLHVKAGSKHVKKNGERIKSNHNNYYIAISRKPHVKRFLSEIRFSITEKQLGFQRRSK